jgi:hypothetical protein
MTIAKKMIDTIVVMKMNMIGTKVVMKMKMKMKMIRVQILW